MRSHAPLAPTPNRETVTHPGNGRRIPLVPVQDHRPAAPVDGCACGGGCPRCTSDGAVTIDHITSMIGRGVQLERGVRRALEEVLGSDLSGVQVHVDRKADQLSHAVSALAFTSGQDIFFRDGHYAPTSPAGLRLLAHEAAHTIQQSSGTVRRPQAGIEVGDPSAGHERDAEHAAEEVVRRFSEKAVAGTPDHPAGLSRGGLVSYPTQRGARPNQCGGLILQRKPAAEAYEPEKNIPRGDVIELEADHLYRVIGFDIGSSDPNKPGITDGLDDLSDKVASSNVSGFRITGLASRSRVEDDGFSLGWKRAYAVRDYFRSRGNSVGITTNSLGHLGALAPDAKYFGETPSPDADPELKARWRAATIEMTLKGPRLPDPVPAPPSTPKVPVHRGKLSFELEERAPKVDTGLPDELTGELRVREYLRQQRSRIIAAEADFGTDRRAIAGAIAWEALVNVLPQSLRSEGPGKVHAKASAIPSVEGDTVAKQVEERGLLPPVSLGERQKKLATDEGAIKYIAAIMAAGAQIAIENGYDIWRDPKMLCFFYQGQFDTRTWGPFLASRSRETPLSPGVDPATNMGAWVGLKMRYLEDAVGVPSSPKPSALPQQQR